MAGVGNASTASPGSRVERKRKLQHGSEPKKKPRTLDADSISSMDDFRSEILLLEKGIIESRKNYNSIVILLEHARIKSPSDGRDVAAAMALYRVFCRLMALGNLTNNTEASSAEITVVQWLVERLEAFEEILLQFLQSTERSRQSTALRLSMLLVKEKARHIVSPEAFTWRQGLFSSLVQAMVANALVTPVLGEFVDEYVRSFGDVRYYTFACLADIQSSEEPRTAGVLHMLSLMSNMPEQRGEMSVFYLDPPNKKKHELHSLTAHRKQAQRAWTSVLRCDLDKSQRKRVLELMAYQIAPCFAKVEMLMDFLTDSFNIGGSTSLMALSGLFYLIQQKNLDYPQFYQKLYSLLDANILQSRHRSHFFRLLDTFLASTHLPAALVASFIKRLSRLCLFAPPSAIVVVVPWIYNLLKSHPSCTFMIHRTTELRPRDTNGWGDPFIMDELDPLKTNAIESSLWEIHTLQSHYHPNVASIAKIISEQFTKQAYNIEDFLDHSYATILNAELSKGIKRPPEVEYEIPKKIYTLESIAPAKIGPQ